MRLKVNVPVRWLRTALVQAAWAATRKKDSCFQAQYRRLAARRGKKRAILAVAHSLLTVTDLGFQVTLEAA